MPLGNPTVLPIQPFAAYGLDFSQLESDFIASYAMPYKQVDKTSGWYYVPDARNFMRAEDVAWSRETGASRFISQYGKDTFIAQPYGGEEPVSDQDAKDWMNGPIDLASQTMRAVVQRILLAREVRVFGIVDGSGAGTTSVTGTGQWDAASPATNPRQDVLKGKAAVHKRIGREANTAILPGLVYECVTGAQVAGGAGAQILEAIKYTQRATGNALTEELMAGYFNLKTVKFGLAVQSDTTKHTTRTVGIGLPEAGAYIWSTKKVYVFYNGEPGAMEPNFGTTFGTDLATPDDYRDDKVKSQIYRITSTVIEKIVCLPSLNILTTVLQ